MKWTVFLASIVMAFSAFSTTPVIANDVSDVVRARANARAGGSTSGHDAYVLKQSGGALGGTKSYKSKKKAAAKHRRQKAAKKKAAAKRRAAIAAKKKAAARQRAAAAQKAKQQRAAAHKAKSDETAKTASEKTDEPSYAPSTAAVLTNQDILGEQTETETSDDSTEVVATNDGDKTNDAEVVTPKADSSSVKEDGDDESGCKRFIPEVGKTISVDC